MMKSSSLGSLNTSKVVTLSDPNNNLNYKRYIDYVRNQHAVKETVNTLRGSYDNSMIDTLDQQMNQQATIDLVKAIQKAV